MVVERVLKSAVERTADTIRNAVGEEDINLYLVDTGAGENKDANLRHAKRRIIERDLNIRNEYDGSGYVRFEIESRKSVCLHTVYMRGKLTPVFLVDESVMVNPRAHATRDAAVQDFISRIP